MRGLEERLRLALEGTETGYWEWFVATDVDRVVRQHGPALRPPARLLSPPASTTSSTGSCIPTTASRCAGTSRPRSSTARRTRSTCASCCPTGACAGCTPAPARSATDGPHGAHHRAAERRHRAPPARGGARVPRRRQPGAGRLDGPGRDARGGRAARRPRRSRTGAPSSSRRTTPPYQQVAVAHVDPEKVRWARELQERYPPDPDSPTGAPAVIRSGRSELYPVIDRALLEAAALDEEQIELVRELQMHSVMVVPLTARGRTLGAMTFVWAESGRQYSTRELELAEELGRRAGLALDHARLFAREHATAETLQRALLPAHAAGAARLRARRPLRAQRRARPRRRRLVRRVRAARRALRDRDRRRRRARDGRRGHDGPDPQRAARLRAQGHAGPGEVIDDLHTLVAASAGAITFATVVYVVLDPRTGAGRAGQRRPPAGADRRRAASSTRRAARRSASAAPTAARSGASRSRPARRCGCTPTG